MKKIVISMMLASSITLLSAATNQEIKQEAKTAIMKMGKSLKMHMKQNMKSGGVEKAAAFCSSEATELSKKINATYKKGISVKRISLKYRNSAAKPTVDEEKVLQQIEKDINAGKKVPPMIVKEIAKNSYKVYKPLYMDKGVCLTCHGSVGVRDEKAYKLIKEKYPHDKAVGYKKGDFRGAFVVTIIK